MAWVCFWIIRPKQKSILHQYKAPRIIRDYKYHRINRQTSYFLMYAFPEICVGKELVCVTGGVCLSVCVCVYQLIFIFIKVWNCSLGVNSPQSWILYGIGVHCIYNWGVKWGVTHPNLESFMALAYTASITGVWSGG